MSTAVIQRAADGLAVELIASDEVYFRLAARVQRFEDCELAYAPGLTHVPAGCVVQGVQFRGTRAAAGDWVARMECAAVAVGAKLSRVYLSGPAGQLTAALAESGYRARKELAFCAEPARLGLESRVRFHRVITLEQWAERKRIHEEGPDNSDGYRVDPADWCELVRRKCATETKESYLIEYEGKICGSIGAIQMRSLLRLKNIVIRPAFRRLGLGREAVKELAALTCRRGLGALGVFGIEGEAGAELYRSAGFHVIGSQTEWSKSLSGPVRSGEE